MNEETKRIMAMCRSEIAKRECTADPIFLFRRRRWTLTFDTSHVAAEHYEAICNEEDREFTEVDRLWFKSQDGYLEWWETVTVFLTREEADAYGFAVGYQYPHGWDVYCVRAQGDLAEALKSMG